MSEDGILVRKTTIYTNYAINCLIIEQNFTFLTVRVSYLFWSTQNTTDDSIDGDDVDAAADYANGGGVDEGDTDDDDGDDDP